MSRYWADGRNAVEQPDLQPGDRIKLDPDRRRWWTVQAVSEHFAACVQQAPFEPKGTLRYTVLDWRNGVRGPCDLIGQGYGDGSYDPDECSQMLSEFEEPRPGDDCDGPYRRTLAVSQRNWVHLRVIGRRPASPAGAA